MRRFTLYATGSASGDAITSMQFMFATTLLGVSWATRVNSITDGAQCDLELSTLPTSRITTDEDQNIIDVLRIEGNFVTSGLSQTAFKHYAPVNVSLRPQDYVYLHAVIAGTVVHTTSITLWVK